MEVQIRAGSLGPFSFSNRRPAKKSASPVRSGLFLRILIALMIGPFAMTLTPNIQTAQAVTQNIGATEHPRILFTVGDIPRLRSQAASTHQSIWSPILEFSQSQLGSTPLAAPTCPDNLDGMRNSGNQLIAFAFSYVITGDRSYLDLTRRHMSAYSKWTDWGDEAGCGNRDLGFHQMLLGFSIAYDWTYNDLTDAERQTFGAQIALRAQQSYEAVTANDYQWFNWWRRAYIQNHHQTNSSALGLAALVLKGSDQRAQTWLGTAVDMMSRDKSILEGIGDGSWHEGISYQSYGLTLSLPFLKSLRQLEGTDLIPHTYLKNYSYWRVYNMLPSSDRHVLGFGDFDWSWGNAYSSQNILRFNAAEYNDGYAEWGAQQIANTSGRQASVFSSPWYVFEFLYYNPGVGASNPSGLSTSRTFADMASVIWRTGWSANDLAFGLKAGGQGGAYPTQRFIGGQYPFDRLRIDKFSSGHDHEDAGTIYLYRGNTELASENVGFQQVETKYHNTLLIDGKGQYRPPDSFGSYSYWSENPALYHDIAGKIAFRDGSPGFEYVVADITNPYRLTNQTTGKPDATMVSSLNRRVLFIKPGYFVMIDDIKAASGHTYDWINHFDSGVSLDGGWIKGVSQNNQLLGVKVLSPSSSTTQFGNDGKPFAQVKSAASSKDLRFVTLLYPTDNANWASRPNVSLIHDDAQASAVRVALNGVQDHLIRNAAQGQVSAGEYRFDGQAASVFKDGLGNIERLMIMEGANLLDGSGSRSLLKSSASGTTLEARYEGQSLTLLGEAPDGTTIYAPLTNPLQVTLNGKATPARKTGDYITVSQSTFPETPTPTRIAASTPTQVPTSTPLPTNTRQPGATATQTPRPMIVAVKLKGATPNRVPALGGVGIQVAGEGFDNNARVMVGGADCDNIQVLSTTEMTCTIRHSPEPIADITVLNPDGASDTLADYLAYDPSLIAPSAYQIELPIQKNGLSS